MSARIFLLGDEIDTDQLAPGQYMRGGISELAAHCLESVKPDFATNVKPGDMIVAGRNFGVGSSREQAAEALMYVGVAGVVALSFAGIFFRNSINLGLPVLVADDITQIEDGDRINFDRNSAVLHLLDKNIEIQLQPLAENLLAILDDGGLVSHLKKRIKSQSAKGTT